METLDRYIIFWFILAYIFISTDLQISQQETES